MKQYAYRIHLLAVFLIAAAPAVARVIGEDTRRAPSADEADLASATGMIFCSRVVDERRRIGAGTGTIVGNRSTVLTAAHVFTDPAGRQGRRVDFDPAADCSFRQYDSTGELTNEVGFSHGELGEYHRNTGAPNQDWAVLRTTEPVPGSSIALPFADQGSDIDELSGLAVKILAFHADTRRDRRTPLVSEGELFGIEYGGFLRLAHTVDMERMSSGAALVHRSGSGQYVVVGVNRSAANLGDFNLAVPLSAELRESLRSFAFGQVPLHRQLIAYGR